jgi:hypothetical protein
MIYLKYFNARTIFTKRFMSVLLCFLAQPFNDKWLSLLCNYRGYPLLGGPQTPRL